MSQSPPLTETTRVALLLCAALGPEAASAKPLTPGEFYRFAQGIQQLGVKLRDLESADGAGQIPQLAEWAKLEVERIQALLARGVALSFRMQEWLEVGIWVISRLDKSYPVRLKARLSASAPPLLYGRGSVELLNTDLALGVVGSRDATDEALRYAHSIGEAAAARGWTIVSGSARGVDRESMGASLNVGGTVIGVEHSGLKKSALERGLRDYFRSSLVLISPYAPEAGFSIGNAMGRNKLVYALSAGTVAVHSGTSGGTWEGVLENLKHQWVPVWIPAQVESPGRAGLLKAGASEFDGDWPPVEATGDSAPVTFTPSVVDIPAPSSLPAASTSQEPTTMYSYFRQLAEPLCATPRVGRDIADALELRPPQTMVWLQRAARDGWIVRLNGKVDRWQTASAALAELMRLLESEQSMESLAAALDIPEKWIKSTLKDAIAAKTVVLDRKSKRYLRADRQQTAQLSLIE